MCRNNTSKQGNSSTLSKPRQRPHTTHESSKPPANSSKQSSSSTPLNRGRIRRGLGLSKSAGFAIEQTSQTLDPRSSLQVLDTNQGIRGVSRGSGGQYQNNHDSAGYCSCIGNAQIYRDWGLEHNTLATVNLPYLSFLLYMRLRSQNAPCNDFFSFFSYHVLEMHKSTGIEDLGTIRWQLLLSLFLFLLSISSSSFAFCIIQKKKQTVIVLMEFNLFSVIMYWKCTNLQGLRTWAQYVGNCYSV